jgi:predicted hydrocarbon binding protein
MHGLVFAALRDFLVSHLDQEQADSIFVSGPPYLMSAPYPDGEFLQLVERGRALSGEPLTDFLRSFGIFTGATTFPRLYPAFYEVAGDTRTFLLTIESRIHELVRATVPDATPPRLHIEAENEERLRIVYDSPRRLCAFLDGLVVGTAAYFGESVEVSEPTCVRRGDAACVFAVGFPRVP